jgi:hypothetical protein
MKKIKFNLFGVEVQLPENAVQNDNYNGTYIHMGAKHTASVIKQYVKNKYNNRYTVWSTSSVYSGGSSVRVNIWSKNGSPAPLEVYNDVKALGNSLVAGSFDGMYDIYEYKDNNITTQKGTPLKYFPSYVFVENNPKWDTPEYWLKEWKNVERCERQGVKTWEDFLEKNRTYFGKGVEVKLVKYMDNLHQELQELGYDLEELCA